jgi:IS4 transposase
VFASRIPISAIYKERWQIELFFKALKQSLKIKTFVGTSANAVRTQIWTALIAMLLIKVLQQRQHFCLGLKQPDRPAALEPLHLPPLIGVDK